MDQQQSKVHKGTEPRLRVIRLTNQKQNRPANQPATGQPDSEGNTGSWADDLEANKETNLTTTLKPLPSTSRESAVKVDSTSHYRSQFDNPIL